MLRREVVLRRSEAVQERFRVAEGTVHTDWMEVAADVQRQVLREFGVRDDAAGLLGLRRAALANPDIAFWVQHNRARQLAKAPGDPVPNVPLVPVPLGPAPGPDAALRPLLDWQRDGRPLVLVAGSYS